MIFLSSVDGPPWISAIDIRRRGQRMTCVRRQTWLAGVGAVLLVCGTGRVGAESLTYAVPLSSKFQNGFAPRFDPGLGTLTEVDFSASGGYGAEFLGGGNFDAMGRGSGTYERTIGFLFLTNPALELSDRQTGLPYDSLYGLATISDTFSVTRTLTSSLGGFIGTGAYNVQSKVSIIADHVAPEHEPFGGLSGTATITYVYTTAVPEPASFVMAGTAVLAGLGIWWRRKRAAA
jgi:hypothetical protein